VHESLLREEERAKLVLPLEKTGAFSGLVWRLFLNAIYSLLISWPLLRKRWRTY